MVQVSAGRLSAGDACRKLVTNENCSRSVEEWWSAHGLLMAAVRNGEIAGERNFEGRLFYWFLNLYTPSRYLALGIEDWEIVKRCVSEAQAAGVISEPEAVLAAVLGGQDISQEIEKLQSAGSNMLYLLSQVLIRQADADEEMKVMGKEMTHLSRVQKVKALLTFVFSFAPLGGAGVGAVAEALPLLENILSSGMSLQGAGTSSLLDMLFIRADSMLSLDCWGKVAPENQQAVREAVEELGLSWDVFCGMVREGVSRRNLRTDEVGSSEGLGGEILALCENGSSLEGSDARLRPSCIGVDDLRDPHDSEGSSSEPGMTIPDDSACLLCPVLVAQDLEVSGAGQIHDNSTIDVSSTMSRLDVAVLETSSSLKEFKADATNAEAIVSMNGEALSRTVAAAMVNFDDDLRSAWHILAESLQAEVRKCMISGDIIVRYPEAELHQQIFHGLRADEAYRSLGDSAAMSFEWRLQHFLRALRPESNG